MLTLVVGVPCAGKSWVCNQLKDLYEYIPHDDFIGSDYVKGITVASLDADKPLLIETPFSISQIMDPLLGVGFEVEPVFIIENVVTLAERYKRRENKEFPAGHVTRQATYRSRALGGGHFVGTSTQVLEHLRAKVSAHD